MNATRREPADPSVRRLALALAVSIGVHVLLILLFMLIPSSEAADDEPEEKTITFDLTEDTEVVPVPVAAPEEPQEVVMAVPSPEDGTDPAPTGHPDAIPQPQTPEAEPAELDTQRSAPEPASEAPDLAAREQPDPAGEDDAPDPGTTFNESDDGTFAPGEQGGSLDPSREGPPRVSIWVRHSRTSTRRFETDGPVKSRSSLRIRTG